MAHAYTECERLANLNCLFLLCENGRDNRWAIVYTNKQENASLQVPKSFTVP